MNLSLVPFLTGLINPIYRSIQLLLILTIRRARRALHETKEEPNETSGARRSDRRDEGVRDAVTRERHEERDTP